MDDKFNSILEYMMRLKKEDSKAENSEKDDGLKLTFNSQTEKDQFKEDIKLIFGDKNPFSADDGEEY